MLDIVGLGPGDEAHLTAGARAVLSSGRPVLLRTRHHPTVDALDSSRQWADCDDLYAAGQDFGVVYRAIADRVLGLAGQGDLVFAVPGTPLIAEQAVALVVEMARDAGIACRVHPGVSFVDVAAAALGRDLGNVQVCDALALRIDPQRPAIVHQVFDRDSATALKLALLEWYPPDHPLTVMHALGSAAESLREVRLADLDHQPFGYLDTVFVPAIPAIEDLRRFDGAYHVIVERLNNPDGGCPWDLEQTHESLRHYLLEETYEALDAIDSGDPSRLVGELGDVLLQVLMHTAVALRSDEFTFGDITEHLSRKLIHRHPHVFGDGTAKTAEDVSRNWEQLKQQEAPRSSILEGIPVALPALAASQSIQGRARSAGFEWSSIEGHLEKLVEEVAEFARAEGDAAEREAEFGDLLFVIAGIGKRLGIDAEQALRLANAKFRTRFGEVERLAGERGVELRDMPEADLIALWAEAKQRTAS